MLEKIKKHKKLTIALVIVLIVAILIGVVVHNVKKTGSDMMDMSLVSLSFVYGESTGIGQVEQLKEALQGKVYNLNGQLVGNSVEGLSKGVYIVNGKKVIIK